MSRKEIGDLIAERRIQCDMTQAQLAAAVDMSAPQVSRWERGVSLPDARVLPRLGAALDMPQELRLQLATLWTDTRARDTEEKIAATQQENADLREENAGMRQELMAALIEVKRFVDTYQSFHAAYQKIGDQVDQLVEEIAAIKQAVLHPPAPKRDRRPPAAP